MNRFLYFIISVIILAHFAACDNCIEGNGKIVSKQLDIGLISNIKLSCAADVEIVTDSSLQEKTLEVSAESNIIDLISVDQNGHDLKIDSKSCLMNHKPINIRLKVRNLKEIGIDGSGTVFCNDTLQCEELDLNVSGSGSIEIYVDNLATNSSIDGSGDIKIKGKSPKHKVTINGSGEVKAFDLQTEKTFISINGSGDCNSNVKDELDVRITGSGDVYYSGNPKLSQVLNGSGEVVKK